ncbi:MAG: sigma-70 family RNA polymerase sigma factor [Gaiellales bacterium]
MSAIDDARLVDGLRARDEGAFMELVERYGPPLRRFITGFVRVPAVADDVLQDTWIGVLRGIDRFEGRSSLKTWLFRIAANTAKTRAVREGRSVPFSSLRDEPERAVDPSRFLPSDDPEWPGHWATPPTDWARGPEARLLSRETRDVIADAIESLPESQRLVITLRDVEGFPADEVEALLEVSEGNQRVLLHRARSRVRAALERYLEETG